LFIIGGNVKEELNEYTNCHLLISYLSYKSKPIDNSTKSNNIPVNVESSDFAVIHFIKQTKDAKPSQLIPIIRTHNNLIQSSGILHHYEIYQITSQDCITPTHFSNYLGVIMFCHALVSGSRIAFTKSKLNRHQTMECIQRYGITSVSIDLSEIIYLLRNDVSIHLPQHSRRYSFYKIHRNITF
jgi:uncharacterized protein YjhX (UPF0386 family)